MYKRQDQNSVSGYEPDILEAKHLLLTESFLYLYLNFSRVMKYLQAQDSLNTQMVTDELLPLLHPDLDMEKNGENDTAKLIDVYKRQGMVGWTDPDNRRSYPWGKQDWELIEFHKDMRCV